MSMTHQSKRAAPATEPARQNNTSNYDFTANSVAVKTADIRCTVTIVHHNRCLCCGKPDRLSDPRGARLRVLGRYDHHGQLCGRCTKRWHGTPKQYTATYERVRQRIREFEATR